MGITYSQGSETGRPVIDTAKCEVCGRCARICLVGCLRQVDGHIQIDENHAFGCLACGHCVMVCPNDAISVSGRRIEQSRIEPMPAAEALPSGEAMLALQRSRRSVRRFTDRAVPEEVIQSVIAAAQTAPFGFPPVGDSAELDAVPMDVKSGGPAP